MAHVLAVAMQYIYPPTDGGKGGIYYRWEKLSRESSLHIAIVNSANAELRNEGFAWSDSCLVFPQVIKPSQECSKIELIRQMFHWLISGEPRQYLVCRSSVVRNKMMEIIKKENITTILLESPFVAGMIDLQEIKKMGIRIVTVFHNVEHIYFQDTNRWPKYLAEMEYHRICKFEKMMLRLSDEVICISPSDARCYQSMLPSASIDYCPTVMPVKKKKWKSDKAREYLVFCSQLSFVPNYEGLLWFLKNVWAFYHEKFPKVKLKITGNVKSEIQSKIRSYSGVELTGFLSDDALDELMSHTLFSVIPVLRGSGVKIKLLDSLSMGIPTIATTHCYEGVEYDCPQEEAPFLVADDSNSFLQYMETITVNKDRRDRLGENGFAYFDRVYASDENVRLWLSKLNG